MKKRWYERPLRIAALQVNFEKGKFLEVADRWARMGFNTEQLFHVTADLYSSLFEPKKHAGLLREYLARARKNNLRIILYLNTHILGPSLAHRKEDCAQRSAGGGYPLLYDTYYACCINSLWRDVYFETLDTLGAFDIDGVFLDGPIFAGGGCHCKYCRALYRRETGRAMKPKTDLSEFCASSIAAYLRESYARFKRVKPHGVHYFNGSYLHPTASCLRLPEVLAFNDIIGTEGGFMFYGPPSGGYLFKPSLAAKVVEALAPKKPRVIFMAADQKPWSWLMHTPTETKLCIASTSANGANIWYGLHGSTQLLDTPGGRAGGEMIRFLADHEEYFDGTTSAARVALMYSYATERHYRASVEKSDFYGPGRDAGAPVRGDFTQSVQGFTEILARSAVPFDIVTDLGTSPEEFRRYDCILLPTCACLDDRTISSLLQYVRRGGALISTFDTSLFDGNGDPRKDFGLADVFNVRCERATIPMRNFNYFKKSAEHPIWDGLDIPLLPAPEFGWAVEPGRGALTLARFLKPLAGRYVALTDPDKPALVLNAYGKGRSLYLAGTFGEMASSYHPPEYRRLVLNAVSLFTRPAVMLENGLGDVEMTVRTQRLPRGRKRRLIVHLINYAGLIPRPFEGVAPQRELRLRVRGSFSRARALAAAGACRTRRESGALVVALPESREYEVVVIE